MMLHRLLYPVRIVLVTSADEQGNPNIITLAWAMPTSQQPSMFAISVGKTRHSHKLISEGGEFVLCIPGRGMEKAIEICGTTSGKNTDKFEAAKLTQKKSKFVKPPGIEECYANLECKLVGKCDSGDHTIFVGEVVNADLTGEKKGIYDMGGMKFQVL
ncbi:MAG: flavin reductase family protein [Candidatus Micrarchaeota archaeon]|nr:flavin reductase family protein [Candidatus Micrarchaeota archaeon]